MEGINSISQVSHVSQAMLPVIPYAISCGDLMTNPTNLTKIQKCTPMWLKKQTFISISNY